MDFEIVLRRALRPLRARGRARDRRPRPGGGPSAGRVRQGLPEVVDGLPHGPTRGVDLRGRAQRRPEGVDPRERSVMRAAKTVPRNRLTTTRATSPNASLARRVVQRLTRSTTRRGGASLPRRSPHRGGRSRDGLRRRHREGDAAPVARQAACRPGATLGDERPKSSAAARHPRRPRARPRCRAGGGPPQGRNVTASSPRGRALLVIAVVAPVFAISERRPGRPDDRRLLPSSVMPCASTSARFGYSVEIPSGWMHQRDIGPDNVIAVLFSAQSALGRSRRRRSRRVCRCAGRVRTRAGDRLSRFSAGSRHRPLRASRALRRLSRRPHVLS